MTAILLATYNGASFLIQQLESLEQQTDRDWICYIHDDGSTDGTPALLKDWVQGHPDRYCILEGPATGSPQKNFLWLLSQVEAEDYFFCDQDDVWQPDKVAVSRKALTELTGEAQDLPALVFSDMHPVDVELKEIAPSFLAMIGRDGSDLRYQRILLDNPAAGTAEFFNRKLRDIAIRWTDFESLEMHDHLLICLAATCGRVAYISSPLVEYRQHGSNAMGAVHESTASKAQRNLTELLTGKRRENKQRYHQLKRQFAGSLVQCAGEEMQPETRKVLQEFSQLSDRPQKERREFYQSHGFDRANNNIWFLMNV